MAVSDEGVPRPENDLDEELVASSGLPYRVELWIDGSFRRVLAAAIHAGLAKASYDAAVAEYPDDRIVLKSGQRIIKSSEPPDDLRDNGE